jgi:putative two-component system response regulator
MDYTHQAVLPQDPDVTALDETTRTLIALAEAVDQRDGHTAGHSERLACFSVTLGMALGLESENLQALYRGGYLHDIGKIGIPDAILFKPGSLTAQEWVTMRSHTTRGEQICKHLKSLAPVLPVIRHHHERWDGSGYPDGLRGDRIPLLARVLQVADIYDALTNPRPYKPAFSSRKALQILQEETDRGWRDPQVVKMFFRLHEGTFSQVPDGSLAPMSGSLAGLRRSLASPS